MAPDALIIQDETLLEQVDVLSGLRPDGYVLINSTRTFTELGLGELAVRDRTIGQLITVPATELALEHLGRAVPNAVLLGAFAAQTYAVTLQSVCDAIRGRFPAKLADKNCAAAAAAYAIVKSQRKEPVDA
jgi:pyruvate ferredoxin oxidoreductase gamma subunit